MVRIFIDTETVPTSREDVRSKLAAGVRPPGNYKSVDAIMKWETEQGAAKREEAIAETALNGLWGELLVIGFAIEDRTPVILTREKTEADLLKTFCELLQDEVFAHVLKSESSTTSWDQRVTWIAHNADFDLRFIWQRSRILGIQIPFLLPLERYPKGPWRYDTMVEWAGWGKYVKLTDLELAFGIDRIDPLPGGGSDVAKAFAEGRIDDITGHCSLDVGNLRLIYQRMTR